MKILQKILIVLLLSSGFLQLTAQNSKLVAEAEQTMLRATQYMVETVSTNGGDETDTSPYRDLSDQEYLSTGEYIKNMNLLISYLKEMKGASSTSHPLLK